MPVSIHNSPLVDVMTDYAEPGTHTKRRNVTVTFVNGWCAEHGLYEKYISIILPKPMYFITVDSIAILSYNSKSCAPFWLVYEVNFYNCVEIWKSKLKIDFGYALDFVIFVTWCSNVPRHTYLDLNTSLVIMSGYIATPGSNY
jgi:hypothetical protein